MSKRRDIEPARAALSTTNESFPPSRARPAQTAPKNAFNALDTLNLVWSTFLRSWKWTLPLGMLLAASFGAAIWFVSTPIYTASATLLVRENSPYIAFKPKEGNRAFVSTQLQLFRTRAVLAPTLEEIAPMIPDDLAEQDPIDWLTENLLIRMVGSSELLRASFRDPRPEVANSVLTSIVNSYLHYHRKSGKDVDRHVVSLLTDERQRREKRLTQLKEKIKTLSKNVTSVSGTTPLVAEMSSSLKAVHDLLIQTEVELEVARANYEAQKQIVANQEIEVSEEELQQLMQSQSAYTETRDRIDEMDRTLASWEASLVNPSSVRRYQLMKENRAALEKSIEEYQKSFMKEAKSQIEAEKTAQKNRQITSLADTIEAKEAMRVYLEKRLDREKSSRSENNVDNVELEFVRSELNREEEVFNRISERIVELKTEQAAPARIELIDASVVPTRADNSSTFLVIAAALGGLVLPFSLAIVLEFFQQRVNDASAIESNALVVVGEVAKLPRFMPSDTQDRLGRRLTLFEESIDQLGTDLRLAPNAEEQQVVAIVSAISGEGKTHVSTQLAISLARSSKEPVVLLEADFRAPDIAELLDIEQRVGLMDVLTGACQLEEAITHGASSNLDVLPAGSKRRDVHALLHEKDIEKMFEKLRKTYRYIVIDTPPVLSAGESLLFSALADVSLICARRGYSRMSQVKQVQDRLERTNSNPMGVVLNGVSRRGYLTSYGDYAYAEA